MLLKRLGTLFLAILLVSAIIPSVSSAADEVVKSIDFDDSSTILLYVTGITDQLKVLATIDGVTAKKDVTQDAVWTSSSPAVVKVDKGLLTGLSKGTSTISAKYKGFTITLNATSDYLFKELQINPNQTMNLKLGETVTMNAYAIDNDSSITPNDVSASATWSSSNNNIVTASGGVLTLVGKGSSIITAAYKGLSNKVTVNVTSPYSKIEIEKTALEWMVGQDIPALQATATVLDSSVTEDVTAIANWKSSNLNIITVYQGNIKPVGAGTAKISVEYLGVSTEITVIVRLPYQAMMLTPGDDLNLFLNDQSVTIKAEVLNDIVSKKDVTQEASWTNSNPFVASVQSGVITPKAAGSTVITVSYNGLSKSLKVTTMQNLLELKASVENLSLFKNETIKLPAVIGTAVDGQKNDYSSMLSWDTADTNVIKIENGKVTAVNAGVTELTAKLRDTTVTIKVIVQEKVLILKTSQNSYSMIVGNDSVLPIVKATFEDGTEKDASDLITWKTSTPNLLVKDGKIKALLGGKVNLIGTYLNKTVTIPVIMENEITNITTLDQIELNPRKSQSIKVIGKDSDDKNITLTSKIIWTSSNVSVATVKGSNVTGVGKGTATLTGTYQGKTLTVTVNVIPRLTKLQSDEIAYKLKVGETQGLEITAIYENGDTQIITNDAQLSTYNKNIATVNNGIVTALKKGSTTIKAIYNNKTITIRIQVK
ncbi:MAG: Ig domain protein group 2 domain protein [Bacilli bacterium]|nr:Ig domain protein group 2 domain protein [Bacilli bacterium]